MPLLEETVDFKHTEQSHHGVDTNTTVEREQQVVDSKSQLTQQAPLRHRKNSQVSQQTVRHRNTSKKKSFAGQVAARLEQAVAQASIKPVNRSADLVPLTHEYDKMKRRLRALLSAAKQYHESMGKMFRCRLEVVVRLSTVANETPLHEKIGNNCNAISGSSLDVREGSSNINTDQDSLTSIHKLGYKQCRFDALEYQETVVAYIEEWERVITTRVDNGLDTVHELHVKLNHYQTKVGVLRKKINSMEKSRNKGSGQSSRGSPSSSSTSSSLTSTSSPFSSVAKMETKLQRNQEKLEEAWKEHETAASMLCHLLEQVTTQGWKDLAPLVERMIEFESSRIEHDSEVFEHRLEALQVDLKAYCSQLDEFEMDDMNGGDGAPGAGGQQHRLPLLSPPALEVPIMMTSSQDNGEEAADSIVDELVDDDDDDTDDNDSNTTSSSLRQQEDALKLDGEGSSVTSDTSVSTSSTSPRANDHRNSSSKDHNKKKKKKTNGIRWPQSNRVTAV